jgi:hypothetical protein
MKLLACLLAATFTGGPALAAKEDRKACKVDADCAVAEDYCGKARPLNKKFLEENKKAMENFQPLMQCPEGSAPEAGGYEPRCKDKQCVLEKKAPAAPETPAPAAPAPKN